MRAHQMIALLLVPVLSLSGCCSIVGQSVFPVTINSAPTGSNITVTDEYGKEMFNGVTPTTVTLAAGESYMHAKSYTIKFSKPGYNDQVTVIKADIDGWFFGNILFGGLIGMLIVDPITGKMWKLQKDAFGNLSEVGAPAPAAPAVAPAAPTTQPNTNNFAGKPTALNSRKRELQIVALNDVPKEMRKYLVSLN